MHGPPHVRVSIFTVALLVSLAGAAIAAKDASAPRPRPADSVRVARLADYLDRMEAFGFSGQVVVAEHGTVLIERSMGWADRRFEVPMTSATRLGIGSVTKNFVAAAILRLETQGRLHVSDPLGALLPDVPADKAGITLSQLMSHAGGLRREVDGIPDAATRDEVVRKILSDPLAEKPGGSFHYSNAGYDLLAAVVERVSGQPFDAFVRGELLAPAGMTASGVAGSPGLPEGPAARGYNEWKEVSAWTEWPAGWRGTGSGRMVSTALDLWRWVEAVRSGRALRENEWQAMSAAHASRGDDGEYGFGLHLLRGANDIRILVMGGDVDGYRAEARFYPAFDRVIVVLMNQDQFGLGVARRRIASDLSRLAQSPTDAGPPAVRRASAVAAGASPVGLWHLPGGGDVEIWEELGQLRLAARGQDAVDVFEPDPGDSTGERAKIRRAAETLMRAAVGRDTALALTVLGRSEFDFAFPFLVKQLDMLDPLYSGLQTVRGLGTISFPWDEHDRRSYFVLHFLDRDVPMFLGWRGTTLYDVTFEEDRPAPFLAPVAPLADGGFATWEPIRSRAVRFRVLERESGEPRLILRTPNGDLAARRVR